MPEGGARDQNLGHLFNVICIIMRYFQILISQQSLTTKHSYLKPDPGGGGGGGGGVSSEIPKEPAPGFMPGGGALGKINIFVICYMHFHYGNKL